MPNETTLTLPNDDEIDAVFTELMAVNSSAPALSRPSRPSRVFSNGEPRSPDRTTDITSAQNKKTRAHAMLMARLGGISSVFRVLDADFLAVHIRDETVIVFFDFNGKEGLLKEDAALFPSDQMVAQLKLILGA